MYKYLLWILKIGTLINIYFLLQTIISPISNVDSFLLIPAQILFLVSAYRCMFPVNYSSHAVLHNNVFSSVFITRFLVTFVEISYIFMFSHVIRIINNHEILIVDIFSWLMVIQVSISQIFVWCAILTKNENLYFYEEIGWFNIFLLNFVCSVIILLSFIDFNNLEILLYLNLLFGIGYLPWQIFHLKSIKTRINKLKNDSSGNYVRTTLLVGFKSSLKRRVVSHDPEDWGGIIGFTWMLNYFVTLIPVWVYFILYTFSVN
tara:strand:+ start:198 stop:980 length:783 start_codon:yes stop_codon:yes gene_type:complete